MKRPDFIKWATSPQGVYLPDKAKPTLATWQPYEIAIFRHIFPPGAGRLPYSRIIWTEPKKSGKTQKAAAVQLFFALFVDVPGEQYVLANDMEGASDRTFRAVERSLEMAVKAGGLPEDAYRRAGTTLTLKNGSTIKALANDYKGGAGGNQSLASIDEVWGFTREKDLGLLTEFAPVPTRENSTVFYTGYQGYEGESNYWHDMIDNVLKNGKPVEALRHIDNGDGLPACWSVGRTFMFYSHQAQQPWHTEEYMSEQRQNLPMQEYLRVWENRRVKNTSAFCTEEQWDALARPDLRAMHEGDQRRLLLAADAATKDDTAALVGVTWDDAAKRVDVAFVRVWVPERGTPLQLTKTIGPEIVALHQAYNVVGCVYDPYQMAAISEMCRASGVNMIEFNQGGRRVAADTALRDMIRGRNLAHYGDDVLREHVINAITVAQGERGIRIDKKSSSRKVDAAVALSMAAYSALELLAQQTGKLETRRNIFYEEGEETRTW